MKVTLFLVFYNLFNCSNNQKVTPNKSEKIGTLIKAATSENFNVLGWGVYTPTTNLYGDITTSIRKPIFSTLPANIDNCVLTQPINQVAAVNTVYDSVKSWVNKISNDFNLGIGFSVANVTVSATLDVTTSETVTKSSELKVDLINISNQTSKMFVSPQCSIMDLSLSADFVADLQTLPVAIADPDVQSEWANYDQFLQRYGNTFISSITYGAGISVYTSTETTDDTDDNLLKVKACLDIGFGTNAKLLDVCDTYSDETITKAKTIQTKVNQQFLGGDSTLRDALYTNFTNDTINAFLNSAEKSTTPINYQLNNLHDFLINQYNIGSDNYQRALNIKAYLMGLLSQSCQTVTSPNGFALRKFESYATPVGAASLTYYRCMVPMPGCQSNAACQYNAGKARAFCNGDDCVSIDQYGFAQVAQDSDWIWNSPLNKDCNIIVDQCKNPNIGKFSVEWDLNK